MVESIERSPTNVTTGRDTFRSKIFTVWISNFQQALEFYLSTASLVSIEARKE